MPDFIAHPYGALIAAQILDDYRFGMARPVSVAPPALPAFPRGPFDLPVIRDCEADGAQHWLEAA